MGGGEYSIECISAKGEHQIIQITQKDNSGPPHFVELGHHQPGKIEIPYEKLENAIYEILDKTGVENSLSHVEIKIINQDVYFIEIGARGGGGRISDTLIYLSTDFDYYKAAILVALGEYHFTVPSRTQFSGIYFLCKQTISLSPLFEYAKGKPWCKELVILDGALSELQGNDDRGSYLIYQLDHKLTLKDIPISFSQHK